MRELGIITADEGISENYSDIEEIFTYCKFNDCKHKSEPGCAVLKALKNGDLDAARWKNYLSLRQEDKFTEGKVKHLKDIKTLHKSHDKINRNKKKLDENIEI
jgi:ribosome biogenesis GTPase